MSATGATGRPSAAPPMFGRGPMAGMGMPVQKAKDFRATLRRFLSYLRPHRRALGIIVVAGVIATVLSVVGPKLLGSATTLIFEGYLARRMGVPGAHVDLVAVTRILGQLFVMYLVSGVFQYLQQYLMAGVAQQTVYALRREVQAKFERLPLGFYDTRPRGDIMSRAVNDLDAISGTLQQNLTQLLTSVLTVVGVIVMMLTISGVLTTVVLLTVPLSLIFVTRIAKRSQGYFVRQQKALGALNAHVAEMYGGHMLVTAFGHEAQSIRAFDALNDEYYEGAWRAQFISGMLMPVMFFVGNVGYVCTAVIGSVLVTRHALAIGDVQAFIQYTRQFSMPLSQLSAIANSIQLTIAAAERVFELLDEPEEPAETSEAMIEAPRGRVQFDRVSFRYTPDTPLIDDMSIDIAPGQMVAIVGPTGAGKTTLVNLLMRFYDVSAGVIHVDGIPITALRRGALRRCFGMVLQDTWLFSGTIRDNIAYGRAGARADAIVQAARAAQADHFIRTLPDSYDTVINEEASNLSQGQKQLLTIARAFLADPAILILDEATSSVDTRTEVLIQRAMAELMRGRTTFVIAHRLSTIRTADLILMMEHGRIVEQGTHDALLRANGRYAALYRSQFEGHGLATA